MIALAAHYRPTEFDPLDAHDLLRDEIAQRRESGYDVDAVVERANVVDGRDRRLVLGLVDELAGARRRPDWPYREPEGLEAITRSIGAAPRRRWPDQAALGDRIHAAWLGRIAGCNLGKPVEVGAEWTSERIRAYLQLAEAYPLRDYFPVLQPMPAGFAFHEDWPTTTRGRVQGSARDDDIDYSILSLHLIEKYGNELRPSDVAAEWLSLLPLLQTFTAERAAYLNLAAGLVPPAVACFRNPYREWIGAQIRADVYGYVHAGDPWAAARLAFQDASLSHVGNGVYGEMWAAALVAAAFVSPDAATALTIAVQVVPPGSRLAEAVGHVLDLHRQGLQWEQALGLIQEAYGHYAWVHTVNNAALVTAALLWGDGDYLTSVALAVMGGWDTDSNGATTGSVAGILTGTAGLPDHLVEPLQNRTRSALFGSDNASISALAARTHRLALATTQPTSSPIDLLAAPFGPPGPTPPVEPRPLAAPAPRR